MVNQQDLEAFLAKAEESPCSAESDFAHLRYKSCANRCYYACFQAAVAALGAAGVGPREQSGQWGHGSLQASFTGLLINRRKLRPSWLGDALRTARALREVADYQPTPITEKQAEWGLRRCTEFVQAIRQGVVA